MYPYLFAGTPFQVETYAFMIILGAIVTTVFAAKNLPGEYKNFRDIFTTAFVIAFFWLLFSKVGYIVINWRDIVLASGNQKYFFLKELFLRRGLISSTGFLSTSISVFIVTKFRKKKRSFWQLLDSLVPYFFILLVFARIGCLGGGCCYGIPTSLPWGIKTVCTKGVTVHPTQAYYILCWIFSFFVMRSVQKKYRSQLGLTTFGGIMLFSFFRFFIEFIRHDRIPIEGIKLLSAGQVYFSLLFFASAGAIWYILKIKKKKV